MSRTLIIQCTSCAGLLMAKDGQRTRTCPYCGAQVTVSRARNVATAENAYAASEILRKLKSKKVLET